MRLFEPLTRKVPSISVAAGQRDKGHIMSLRRRRQPHRSLSNKGHCAWSVGTFELKKLESAPFRHHHWDVAPHIQLSIRIRRRYLHACMLKTVLERPTEDDALSKGLCAPTVTSLS